MKRWDLTQAVAAKLTELSPGHVGCWVSLAYATRRAVSIEAARSILLDALERFPGEVIVSYNFACYECRLGNIERAKELLGKCFALESQWRSLALDDEDLEPLRDGIGAK